MFYINIKYAVKVPIKRSFMAIFYNLLISIEPSMGAILGLSVYNITEESTS